MKVIKGINNLPNQLKRPVLAIGMFDGLHLGHQKIIRELLHKAQVLKGTSMVLTFMPHPLRFFQRQPLVPLICSLEDRIDLLKKLGVNLCLLVDFNKKFSRISAADFIQQVLVETLRVNCLIVGRGFRFGRDKEGDFSLLKDFSRRFGFKLYSVNPVKINNRIVSSSRIRALIQAGKMEKANKMLGRNFSIAGKVRPGSARGRILGYPTANIDPQQEILPLPGVYAVLVKLDQMALRGILNIGCRPTFLVGPSTAITVEVHIFNFRSKIYGKALEVFFVRRIRSERKFASRQALLAQIKKDELKAKQILR